MSSRGITLLLQPQERVYVPNRGEGFRLRVTATDAVDMPAEIFLHQTRLVDPVEAVSGDEFMCICSPFDLTIYPAQEPDLLQFPQFFRKSVLDVILPSQAVAEESWLAIYGEVNGLIEALNKLEYLLPGESVRCGEPLAVDDSESVTED
jgi:hypothetical protein